MQKNVWAPIAVTVRYIPARARNEHSTAFRVDVPVTVEAVEEHEAPVAIVAQLALDAGRTEIKWRLWNGELWRPLLGTDEQPLLEPAESLSLRVTDREWLGRYMWGGWRDYPFFPAANRARNNHFANLAQLPLLDGFDQGRRIADNRAGAEAEARGVAAQELVEIGGVIHRRSVAPVWTADFRSNPPYSSGQVKVVLRDYYPCETGTSFFADRDDAVEMRRRLHEFNATWCRTAGMSEPAALAQPFEDGIVFSEEVPRPDYVLESARAVAVEIEEAFSVVELQQMPRKFLLGYAKLVGVLEGTSGIADVLEGCDEMVANCASEYTMWPRVHHALRDLSTTRIRAVLEEERANELDLLPAL